MKIEPDYKLMDTLVNMRGAEPYHLIDTFDFETLASLYKTQWFDRYTAQNGLMDRWLSIRGRIADMILNQMIMEYEKR